MPSPLDHIGRQHFSFRPPIKNADPNASPDGGWALQLRPVTNAADSPENIESIFTVLLDGLSPAGSAKRA